MRNMRPDLIRKMTAAVMTGLILCIQGIGYAAPGIRDALRFLTDEHPVHFSVTAEFGKLPQYDENRTEQLNRIIRHFAFDGYIDSREANLTVLLDGNDLFSLSQTEVGGALRKTLLPDSEHAYLIPEDETAMSESDLFFSDVFSAVKNQINLKSTLETYAAFFESLPDSFPEKTRTADIMEKYKDYGTAVRKVTVHIDAEELSACISEQKEDFA